MRLAPRGSDASAKLVAALGRTGAVRWSALPVDPADRHKGDPVTRPKAEPGGRADPTPRFIEGEGNAHLFEMGLRT